MLRRIIFFVLILVFAVSMSTSRAFAINEKDPFTDQIHRQSRKQFLGYSQSIDNFSITLFRKENEFGLILELNARGSVDHIILENSPVMFKLENGNTIELRVKDQVIGTSNLVINNIQTQFNITLMADHSDFKKLSESNFEMLRFQFDVELTLKIKSKHAESVKTIARCILSD